MGNTRASTIQTSQGSCGARSGEHLTLGFGLGHDLRVRRLRPEWGSALSKESSLLRVLSLPPHLPLPTPSLSRKKKIQLSKSEDLIRLLLGNS